ncbi:MAG: tRNA (N(6)-L-threonylcarbamoyladenosine(37)-C(2))-methylthiotransferase [Thermoproteota archaeon]|nr:tRNA (N(6)-L-threonylcarbamoyladenosine(37)-C(2))-methylthiotransferase [Thermoproteota archaeon]
MSTIKILASKPSPFLVQSGYTDSKNAIGITEPAASPDSTSESSIERQTQVPPDKTRGKVWIEAYGCSSSMNDSEIMSGLLMNEGYGIAKTRQEASINVIVTCSVKDNTEHKMLNRIAKLTESSRPLVVAGCLPKADQLKVQSINPRASLIGPATVQKITKVVQSSISGKKQIELESEQGSFQKLNIPKIRLNPLVSIVQIASGCLSQCSFCQTKLIKADLKSYRLGDILRQVRTDVAQGCKEIWLSSTDNGCYGRDIGTDLTELLKRCCEIRGDFKIRVGMMNPMYIPQLLHDLLGVYIQNDQIMKFLHIPVQSGSNRILKKMKRGHSAQTFLNAVQAFREKIPELTIATDVIVGYPSETEEDFHQTIELLRVTQPDIVNVSKYSSRPGVSAALEKKVDSHITKQRTQLLDKILNDISSIRNSRWLGWKGEVLVDEIGDNYIQGRNYAYKPILLNASAPCSCTPCIPSLGSKIFAKVVDYSRYALRADML